MDRPFSGLALAFGPPAGLESWLGAVVRATGRSAELTVFGPLPGWSPLVGAQDGGLRRGGSSEEGAAVAGASPRSRRAAPPAAGWGGTGIGSGERAGRDVRGLGAEGAVLVGGGGTSTGAVAGGSSGRCAAGGADGGVGAGTGSGAGDSSGRRGSCDGGAALRVSRRAAPPAGLLSSFGSRGFAAGRTGRTSSADMADVADAPRGIC